MRKPDITTRQSKLQNIKKTNESLHLCMTQSIYILRLLLFKYQIINATDIFEESLTIMTSIKEFLRERLIKSIKLRTGSVTFSTSVETFVTLRNMSRHS